MASRIRRAPDQLLMLLSRLQLIIEPACDVYITLPEFETAFLSCHSPDVQSLFGATDSFELLPTVFRQDQDEVYDMLAKTETGEWVKAWRGLTFRDRGYLEFMVANQWWWLARKRMLFGHLERLDLITYMATPPQDLCWQPSAAQIRCELLSILIDTEIPPPPRQELIRFRHTPFDDLKDFPINEHTPVASRVHFRFVTREDLPCALNRVAFTWEAATELYWLSPGADQVGYGPLMSDNLEAEMSGCPVDMHWLPELSAALREEEFGNYGNRCQYAYFFHQQALEAGSALFEHWNKPNDRWQQEVDDKIDYRFWYLLAMLKTVPSLFAKVSTEQMGQCINLILDVTLSHASLLASALEFGECLGADAATQNKDVQDCLAIVAYYLVRRPESCQYITPTLLYYYRDVANASGRVTKSRILYNMLTWDKDASDAYRKAASRLIIILGLTKKTRSPVEASISFQASQPIAARIASVNKDKIIFPYARMRICMACNRFRFISDGKWPWKRCSNCSISYCSAQCREDGECSSFCAKFVR